MYCSLLRLTLVTTMTFSEKFLISLPSVQSFYLSYLHHPSQSSIRQVPSTSWHYSTLAFIQFIPRIKIAYHNYKKALVSSYLSPEQQFKSLNHNSRSQIESHTSPFFLHIKIQIENATHINMILIDSIHQYVSIISIYQPNLSFT